MKQLITLCLLAFIGIKQVNAQWSGQPVYGGTGLAANNSVYSVCADVFGNVYTAGNFTNGNGNYYVAKWDGTTWGELGGSNALGSNGNISCITTDASGNVYAAVSFTSGPSKYYVAKWNGSSWSELGGTNALGANNGIYSVCTDASGNVYATGNFTNGSGKRYVAKWNGSSWSELGGTNALGANANINSVCTDASGNVYASGNFTNFNSKYYVAKWNGSGWSELGGTNALAVGSTIYNICSDASGNIYVVGAFTNGSGKNYVAKWNGSSWSELGGTNALAANGATNYVCTDASGNVYVGGNFTNSNSNNYVAKWNGSSWSELGGTSALAGNSSVYSVCTDASGNVYAGGNFSNGYGFCYVSKYNGTTWAEIGTVIINGLATNSNINSVCTDAWGTVYAAGSFSNGSTISIGKRYVTKYDGTTWGELGGANALGANSNIISVCTDVSGNVYATGGFTNGNNKFYVAKYDGTTWGELGGTNALAANSTISSICTDASGNVYAAGNFTNGSTVSSGKRYVAKWNGSGWSELGGTNALAANSSISSVCIDASGNVYAAGNFTNGSTVSSGKRYVAKWNGSGWSELGGTNALGANSSISFLCTDAAGNVYAAGSFTNGSTSSTGKRYVAKWNGSSWSELGGTDALGANANISSICADAWGNIYAGGAFTNGSTSSTGKRYVAQWDGTTWSELGGTNAFGANNNINFVCADVWGNVYAGGSFADSKLKKYLAKYIKYGSCIPTTGIFTVTACNTYTWAAKGNKVYTESNNVDTIHLTNVAGCDSVVILHLTINTPTGNSNTQTACDSYTWYGAAYTTSGTYTYSYNNGSGCTSVDTLYLTVNSGSISTTNLTILSTQMPYHWNGLTFDAAGSQTAHLINVVGCDSAATLNLTVASACSPTSSSTIQTACSNYTWNNQTYTASGTYTKTGLTNALGCDSTATLVLTINSPSLSTTTYTACSNYTWNNQTYTTSGTYTKTGFINVAGCDSMAILNLTINQPSSSTTTASVCSNQLPYTWNGLTFSSAGTQTKTSLTNAGGCDSTATLILTVTSGNTVSISIAASGNNVCAGTSVTFTATPTNGGITPTYQWKKNNTNVGTNSNTYTDVLLNNNDSVWCILTSNSACVSGSNTSTSNKVKIIIKSVPVIGTSYSTKTTLCSIGATTAINNTNTTNGGVWSSDNTGVISVVTGSGGAGGTATAVGNGTAIVTYTKISANGCSVQASMIIKVDVQSTPGLSGVPTGLCKGSSVTVTPNPTGGIWVSNNVSATVNSSGIIAATNTGTTSITYTVINSSSCSGVATVAIPVYAIPAAPGIGYGSGSINPQTGAVPSSAFCNNRTFTLVGNPTGGSWSTTNAAVVTVTSGGVVQTVGLGTGSVVYTVTNAGGCSNSKSIVGTVVGCVPRGVNNSEVQIQNLTFNLYPNPARSMVNINIDWLVGNGTIIVTDIYGKQVKERALSIGTNTIDISKLSKGIYFVSIITEKGKETKKIIVE